MAADSHCTGAHRKRFLYGTAMAQDTPPCTSVTKFFILQAGTPFSYISSISAEFLCAGSGTNSHVITQTTAPVPVKSQAVL